MTIVTIAQQLVRWATFSQNRHGQKGGGCAPLGGTLSPSNTVSPEPRPTSLPSGILIQAAVWRQQTPAENWGLCPFLGGGKLGPYLTQCGVGRGLPSGILIHPTVWPQYSNITDRQTDNG